MPLPSTETWAWWGEAPPQGLGPQALRDSQAPAPTWLPSAQGHVLGWPTWAAQPWQRWQPWLRAAAAAPVFLVTHTT